MVTTDMELGQRSNDVKGTGGGSSRSIRVAASSGSGSSSGGRSHACTRWDSHVTARSRSKTRPCHIELAANMPFLPLVQQLSIAASSVCFPEKGRKGRSKAVRVRGISEKHVLGGGGATEECTGSHTSHQRVARGAAQHARAVPQKIPHQRKTLRARKKVQRTEGGVPPYQSIHSATRRDTESGRVAGEAAFK